NKNYIYAQGKVKTVPFSGAGGAGFIRPDGEAAGLINWAGEEPNAADHDTCIDNDVRFPDTNKTDWIQAESLDDSDIDVFEMGTLTATSVEGVTVHLYVYRNGTSDDFKVDISIDDWGTSEGLQTINTTDTTNGEWVSYTYSAVGYNQAQLSNLEVKLKAPTNIPVSKFFRVYIMYVELSYTGALPTALGLTDDDGVVFTWNPNEWVNDQDVGLLIVDNTNNITSKTYNCTNIDVWGEDVAATGNCASLDTINDGDVFYCYQTKNGASYNMNIGDGTETGGMILGGDNIDTDQKLHKIELLYNIGLYSPNGYGTAIIEIKKDAAWIEVAHINIYAIGRYAYHFGTFTIPDNTDIELAKYLTVDGANYDELKGVRVRLEDWATVSSTVYVRLDRMYAIVYHDAYDIVPIMEQIDDNGASWIGVDSQTWANSGVIGESEEDEGDGDRFKIGENTTQILADVSIASEVEINLQTTLSKYIALWFCIITYFCFC
ncbi:hypothetical protein LCGC14_2136060, partial [marine sediment metagenome]